MPEVPVKIMMNVGTPDQAFAFSQTAERRRRPGPARVHHQPADRHPPQGPARLRAAWTTPLADRSPSGSPPTTARGTTSSQRVAEGVATIAAAFAPEPVIVRMSDFKSNEYANLVGGELYEPHEENPMIGFRGASRYLSPDFPDCFAMECEALRYVRDEMGLTNVKIMIPSSGRSTRPRASSNCSASTGCAAARTASRSS